MTLQCLDQVKILFLRHAPAQRLAPPCAQSPVAPQWLDLFDTHWCLAWRASPGKQGAPRQGPALAGTLALVDAASWHAGGEPPHHLVFVPQQVAPRLERVRAGMRNAPIANIQPCWGTLLTQWVGMLSPFVLASVAHNPLGTALLERQLLTLLDLTAGALACELRQDKDAARERLFRRIRMWLSLRFADADLTITRTAREFQVSVRYVHQLFADYSRDARGRKETFQKFLNRLRLERAADILKDPTHQRLPIGEIAWRCGYSDPVYFGKVFRLHYRSPPGKARQCWQHRDLHAYPMSAFSVAGPAPAARSRPPASSLVRP